MSLGTAAGPHQGAALLPARAARCTPQGAFCGLKRRFSVRPILLFSLDQPEKMPGLHPASFGGEDRQDAGTRPGSEFP